jgi:hypothetical protein
VDGAAFVDIISWNRRILDNLHDGLLSWFLGIRDSTVVSEVLDSVQRLYLRFCNVEIQSMPDILNMSEQLGLEDAV